MRAISLLFLLLISFPDFAADSFQTAQQFYQTGAPHLALARIERDQTAQPDQAIWYEWESLRLTLLSETKQAAEILKRVKLYPDNAPHDFLQKALGHTVWAQMELNENRAARISLARLIWQFDLNPADLKWARRLVIRSYLLDHKAADAYHAMLRFQQDYQPLPQEIAEDFVQGLLTENLVTEATTWLSALDAGSPTLLALQLKSGLMTPDAALRQARAALQKNQNSTAYAAIVADAAALLKDDRQQIIALEQWLHLAKTEVDKNERILQLWQAYQREAERLGNEAQVLRGDDNAWLELAASRAEDRLGARALYAYISQYGSDAGLREIARAKLYAAWVSAQLEGVAVHVFTAALWNGKPLSDADLERMLTYLAENLPNAATRHLYFTAGRLQEARKNALAAADYFAQTVLKSDLRAPDALTMFAIRHVRSNLEQTGFKEEADLYDERVRAQTSPAPKIIPRKTKRKK